MPHQQFLEQYLKNQESFCNYWTVSYKTKCDNGYLGFSVHDLNTFPYYNWKIMNFNGWHILFFINVKYLRYKFILMDLWWLNNLPSPSWLYLKWADSTLSLLSSYLWTWHKRRINRRRNKTTLSIMWGITLNIESINGT